MKKSSPKEIIERTGALMLKGWKLLAISCPICTTALVSKGNQMRCPGCDLPVMMEGQQETRDSVLEPVKEESESQSQKGGNNLSESELPPVIEPKSYDELRNEYEMKNKKSNRISSKLGEKMLEGWTMLADSCLDMDNCEGTPLVKDPGSGKLLCVSCGKEYIIDSYGDLIDSAAVSLSRPPKPSVNVEEPDIAETNLYNEDTPRLFNFEKNPDDSSWKISQKLLLGWGLLDECCKSENCRGNTPLLRDLKGKKYCVECGYVDDLLTKESPKVVLNEKIIAKSDDLDDDSAFADLEEEVEDERKVQSLFRYQASNPEPVDNGVAELSKVKAIFPLEPVIGASQGKKEVKGTKDSVTAVLLSKLDNSAIKLQESDSVDNSIKLAQLITSLAEAVKAVQNI